MAGRTGGASEEGAQKPRDKGDELALESREKGDKVWHGSLLAESYRIGFRNHQRFS